MTNDELANQIVALGFAFKRPDKPPHVRYSFKGHAWMNSLCLTEDPRVTLALMEAVYANKYSFLLIQMPDEKPMMTIQAPIRTAGEYADPSVRNNWASQVCGDSFPRSIQEACVKALTAVQTGQNDG